MKKVKGNLKAVFTWGPSSRWKYNIKIDLKELGHEY